MRFALILVFLSSAFVSTEASASSKHRKHRATHAAAKAKPAKSTKKTRKAVATEAETEVADADSDEPAPAPKVEKSAPVSRGVVAQVVDDEEPPAKPKKR
jgi:hypothetical protein